MSISIPNPRPVADLSLRMMSSASVWNLESSGNELDDIWLEIPKVWTVKTVGFDLYHGQLVVLTRRCERLNVGSGTCLSEVDTPNTSGNKVLSVLHHSIL